MMQMRDGVINENRRNFLKLLGVGTAALVVGKISQSMSAILSGAHDITSESMNGAKIADNGKEIKVFSNSGDEILVIDKESFQE